MASVLAPKAGKRLKYKAKRPFYFHYSNSLNRCQSIDGFVDLISLNHRVAFPNGEITFLML